MKLTKFDIGGEIISILTKGMYPDPRDSVREYIQNGVDAKADSISVEVYQNTVVVQDDGIGMDRKRMRNAVRLGVSDKNPSQNVGFMGIGIYSAFHLCDNLTIYSNTGDSPNNIRMDFQGMREILKSEKRLRFQSNKSSEELTDLQTLLEKHINLSDEGELDDSEFPDMGTRVEMQGLAPAFYSEIADFKKFSEYIKEAVPLRFDKTNFKWGKLIEDRIAEICEQRNATFELVNINLQVHNKSEMLYRPYRDSDFHNNAPQEPRFEEIKAGKNFFGVAWGCHNSIRRIIRTRELRGFLIKKQGFAIGKREHLIKRFPKGDTYFNRYVGEIILVHPWLIRVRQMA